MIKNHPENYVANKRRYIYILLGLIINLCLGSVYSWSVFRKPLEQLFKLSATESSLPYMFFLVFYAILMPLAGRFLDKFGPRMVSIVGGILVSIGWILAGFSNGLINLILGYGIIAGTGVGIVYGVPIAVSAKWFEDKRGFAVGLTVLGFGMSPLITAPIARKLIEVYGPQLTFRILGVVFLVVIILLSIPLKFPAKKEKSEVEFKNKKDEISYSTSEMVKTKTFWALWFCFVIGTLSGLMAIGISSPVGQEIIKLSAETAALSVSIFAIFNGIGRPFFGWLVDKITPRFAAIFNFSLMFLASMGMLFAKEKMTLLYMITFSLLWLSLGGWLSIAPTATAKFFGTIHYSKNYGILFTGYGVGAVLGNLMSGKIRDIFGSYIFNFYITAILSIIGIIIILFYLKPTRKYE
ncbi:major facilitator superfamily MFS_1 [Caldicellulosiruptor kronotskyensis 2002]|uniref:Major facilitator superfamily MFS_1 n=1 Tax=Caldicellulosiruptor kronotskyensis (strain DSM 18902 / VKM B-2412 / 2002) TaxID=632348 RepID=E4SF48_CALK2|nr:OFA family MFS transporter [Caldicellulosiruptor kronotskyensis]ADQ46373.1 major facilitator superfamily MFS_1 [Caldicellulosiruptor kronotskyensis 2002]